MSLGRILALVLAVAIAAAAIARRDRLSQERKTLAVVLIAALVIYGSGVLKLLPDPETAIEDLANALGQWTYVLVGAMAFLETGAFVGLIAPGEFSVIVGGVIAGQGEIRLIPLLGIVWACCILGDSTSFLLGRKLGRGFLERHGKRILITPERLVMVESYFERHGGKTVLIGRFLGLVRAVAPFVAGSSGMRYGRFLPYSILGTGLWGSAYTLLGYFSYRSLDRAAQIAGQAGFAIGTLVGGTILIVWSVRRLRRPEERMRIREWVERQAQRPALRPLVAILRPVWRFVLAPIWRVIGPPLRITWHRLTPGDLGIEFTTLIAIAAVGSYVFIGYAIELSEMPRATRADREVADMVADIRTDTGVDVAKQLTDLGSTGLVIGLVAAGAVALAIRRRPLELAALVGGFLAVYVAVPVAKGGVARPRPPNGLVEAEGKAYPSGHAAYSTAYIAMATIATRVFSGIASRAAVVLVGAAVAAIIGATRVYLGVHYWSDVVGGWGLGLACFSLAGTIALVVAYVRNNEAAARPADRDTAVDRA